MGAPRPAYCWPRYWDQAELPALVTRATAVSETSVPFPILLSRERRQRPPPLIEESCDPGSEAPVWKGRGQVKVRGMRLAREASESEADVPRVVVRGRYPGLHERL